ncbi:hypothetical protein BN946_scf184911.g56 [Trametes cinnabarina]|uniref:FAD-binding PCMH-type domain-containing protein n=1 Tax=Pycnoporus cinnabarinus TaxID=5643 RepID=A0A060SBG8_PYCCI|nr:hypothetical protein BN946_scf184911.g56 [Trametes cinnabarina]
MLLLIFLFGLRLLLNATFSRAAPPSSQDRCRCLFGDACWPSTDDFASLQKQLSQPLLHPLPPASPCYPISHPSGDCDEVHQQWTNASWRAHQPGAMQGENFETFVFSNGTTSACFMDTSLGVPCTQGSVPVIGVDARDDVDLQAAVRFAASHNLRLVVKGTGHDLSGRSTARGSFIIWTHNMKNITFHDTFTPQGAPQSDAHDHAITLGSGVQWQEAYEAVTAKNRVLVGGLSAGGTVGAAGGWVLGGGHSVLSPSFGLGVDNALQFTMISSNGTRYVANAYQYANLFFALRGGGGGTYGVVTSVTYQTHPNLPLIAAAFATSTNSTTPNAPLETLFSDLIHLTPELSDAGWSGFFSLAPDPTTGALGLSGFFVMLNGTLDRANEDLGRFFSTAQSLANASDNALTVQTSFITPVDSFFIWYQNFFPQTSSAGSNGAIGSWLLPRDVIEQDPDRVVKTLLPLTILSIS